MIVSPSEPEKLKSRADIVSNTPELFGCDVLWHQPGFGLVGVQRKEFPGDFLSSMGDRFPRLFGRMAKLSLGVLVIEGAGTWTTTGELAHGWGQEWDRSKHRRFLFSVRARGVWVEQTDNLDDTIAFLADLHAWAAKPKHQSMVEREKGTATDGWGFKTERAKQMFLLQGFDGVGADLAGRMLDTVGMPLGLAVSEDELRRVHGVGPVTIRQIKRTLGVNDGYE